METDSLRVSWQLNGGRVEGGGTEQKGKRLMDTDNSAVITEVVYKDTKW